LTKCKWVPANLKLGGNPAMDYYLIQGGAEILLAASLSGSATYGRREDPMIYNSRSSGSGSGPGCSKALYSQCLP